MFPGAEWVFHQCLSVIQSCNFAHGRQRFGLRWQPAEAKRSEDWSAAATPLSALPVASKSGVALRFPPQSKICGCGVSRAGFIRGKTRPLLYHIIISRYVDILFALAKTFR
jgi:hypothetical protein